MNDSIYEETLEEVAKDLGYHKEYLEGIFRVWLNNSNAISDSHKPACYAIYRITKLKSACRMASSSREKWRDRAIELGSPGNLVDDYSSS